MYYLIYDLIRWTKRNISDQLRLFESFILPSREHQRPRPSRHQLHFLPPSPLRLIGLLSVFYEESDRSFLSRVGHYHLPQQFSLPQKFDCESGNNQKHPKHRYCDESLLIVRGVNLLPNDEWQPSLQYVCHFIHSGYYNSSLLVVFITNLMCPAGSLVSAWCFKWMPELTPYRGPRGQSRIPWCNSMPISSQWGYPRLRERRRLWYSSRHRRRLVASVHHSRLNLKSTRRQVSKLLELPTCPWGIHLFDQQCILGFSNLSKIGRR